MRTRLCSKKRGPWLARPPIRATTAPIDLLVSSVIRTNEMQVWFVAEHVVAGPLVHADGETDS
jgi:hypothetical protein